MDFLIDERDKIKQMIKTNLEGHKNLEATLDYIKYILDEDEISISSKTYIEEHYIKDCLEFWLQDGIKQDVIKRTNNIQDNENLINSIKCLNDIPIILKTERYYELLMKYHKLIENDDEIKYIEKFKQQLRENELAKDASAKIIHDFLNALTSLLYTVKDYQSVIKTLQLSEFFEDKLWIEKLFDNIKKVKGKNHGENLTILQNAIKSLKEEEVIALKDKIKSHIHTLNVKPGEPQEKNIDGRSVLEIAGGNIVISEILQQLENKLLNNEKIEEVHIVNAYIIHVDENLTSRVWRGKNILVSSRMIEVHGEITWDFSGNDSEHIYSENAGTGTDGCGKQGQDGYAGESGGNVVIETGTIDYPQNFTIVSHGGKGSNGQDGGNGKDGQNGVSISIKECKKMFPSNARYKDEQLLREYRGSRTTRLIKKMPHTEVLFDWNNDCHSFIKAKQWNGCKIIYSYCERSFAISNRQNFLLFKGSDGQPGCEGGEFGLGGEGGYNGDVIINHPIKIEATKGEDGENGKGGSYGNFGKNGWDVGYTDYFSWVSPSYFGANENSKLNLEYFDVNQNRSRIWCCYNNKYANITASAIEHKNVKYQERKCTRQNYERKQQAKAFRKKNISQIQTSMHNDEKNSIFNLNSNVENLTEINSLAIKENQKQKTVQRKVKRCIKVPQQIKKRQYSDAVTVISNSTSKVNVENLIGKLKTDSLQIENWFQLKKIELSIDQFNRIYSIFTKTTLKNTDIEMLLIYKCHVATLKQIENHLPPYKDNVESKFKLTPQNEIKYLYEIKAIDCEFNHHILGTLKQFFFENNENQSSKVATFCKYICSTDSFKKQSSENNALFVSLDNTDCKALKHSVKAFILDKMHSSAYKCYDEYETFLKKNDHHLNTTFEAFKREMKKSKHAVLFSLWIKNTYNESVKSKIEMEIRKDKNLLELYNNYKVALTREYEWNKCYEDEDIFKNYIDYMEKRGPLSKCYNELLAYSFNVNIRIYVEDQNDCLFLRDNHNPSSERTVYILCRNDKFVQLNINKDHLGLDNEREWKNKYYEKILADIKPFKRVEELLDYSKKQTFSPDCKQNGSFCEDYHVNENRYISEIIEDFPVGEKQQLEEKLLKLTSRYIGQHGILFHISKRFSKEGCTVSFDELSYLVNSILASVVGDKRELNIFCWIVAAYPQNNWIDELLLLEMENYFKRPIGGVSKWRKCLSKVQNKNILLLLKLKLNRSTSIVPVSAQCIENILHLLSNITKAVIHLEDLELSEWSFTLKEHYWKSKLLQLTTWEDDDKTSTASYHILSMENIFGTDATENFLNILKTKNSSPDIIVDILLNFYNEKWKLSNDEIEMLYNNSVEKWVEKMNSKFSTNDRERNIKELVLLVQADKNTSKRIHDQLSTINRHITEGTLNELTKIDDVIKLKRGFRLRDTQKLTILALILNDHNTLAQVSTGEGKTLIVVAMAILKVLSGQKVDVVTSSSVLAKRDAEINKDIYSSFKINVAHNCNEDVDERKRVYSSNQVVYGDLSNFQRDYLLDCFYEKNTLGDRKFENIIVDEVDHMLLDKGNNMLYLSHDVPDFDKLESVYLYIWQLVNIPIFDINVIKDRVLYELYGTLKKEDIKKLDCNLSEQHENDIWKCLINANIIDSQGKPNEHIKDFKLKGVLSPEICGYEDRLEFLLRERCERKKQICIPNFLKPFVDLHLETWIKSAMIAFSMKSDEDYVVDIDRTHSSLDRNPNINILDRDTGTDLPNSQWDDALQQFLQMKHGCKLSLLSLKAVFISNVSFLKLYLKLYGLTGTLGSHVEREFLKEIHDVDYITVPTARSKKFVEKMPIVCIGKEEWIRQICDEAVKLTKEERRSVLIICETVNEVKNLYKAFKAKNVKNVHTYERDYEKFDIAECENKLDQGLIIIATNLAGRGTDIKLSEKLKEAGGLHICLSYLPNNNRIEQQAFGRAARNGEKGSGQLIVINATGQTYSNSQTLDLKKKRDNEEIKRISEIKTYYETQIMMEEYSFKSFNDQYQRLRKRFKSTDLPAEVQEILLHICLDKWTFWLDRESKSLINITDDRSKRNFKDSLEKFISQIEKLNYNDWLSFVGDHPIHAIKLGKWISKNYKDFDKNNKENYSIDNAIKIFDYVIEREPQFSEAAHYYKAFILARKIDWKKVSSEKEYEIIFKELKNDLQLAEKLFNEKRKFCVSASITIGMNKRIDNQSIIQIKAYEEQQQNLINLYDTILNTINRIFGYPITPKSFEDNGIEKNAAKVIYDSLLKVDVLKKQRIKNNISEEELTTIISKYETSANTLKDFLSQYEGKNIEEKEFEKSLKNKLQLPCRKTFWKMLIDQKVITEEFKFFTIDNEKLSTDSLLSTLVSQEIQEQFKSRSLDSDEHNQIFFNTEQIEHENMKKCFNKSDLKKIKIIEKYQVLKRSGVLLFNKVGRINPINERAVTFSRYDSITIEDFTRENISKSEAEKLLLELIETKVIEKQNDSESSVYRLLVEYDEIENLQFSFPVYKNAVKRLLFSRFTYRKALQNISRQLEEKKYPIELHLPIYTHQRLIADLIDQRIIKLVILDAKVNDFENVVKKSLSVDEEDSLHVIKTLKQSMLLLNIYDCELKSLEENNQNELKNTDEMHRFCLNELDKTIEMKDNLFLNIKNNVFQTFSNLSLIKIFRFCRQIDFKSVYNSCSNSLGIFFDYGIHEFLSILQMYTENIVFMESLRQLLIDVLSFNTDYITIQQRFNSIRSELSKIALLYGRKKIMNFIHEMPECLIKQGHIFINLIKKITTDETNLKSSTMKIRKITRKDIKKVINEYNKSLDEISKKYKTCLNDSEEKVVTITEKMNIDIDYEKNIYKLLVVTKDPKLFAEIVRRNVPMDMVYVNACTHVIYHILLQNCGIKGIKIVVEMVNGKTQEFVYGAEEFRITITLILKDNHFRVVGDSDSKNNCLYYAISKQIGLDFKMTSDDFKNRIAEFIEQNPGTYHYIEQGLNHFLVSKDVCDGASNIKTPAPNQLNEKAEEYIENVKKAEEKKKNKLEEKREEEKKKEEKKQIKEEWQNEEEEKEKNLWKYQHAGWYFNPEIDVDLRKITYMSNIDLQAQLAEAFNIALNTATERLSFYTQEKINISPKNFRTTRYDTILARTNDSPDLMFYPVDMEAKIEVTINHEKKSRLYFLTLDLNNPVDFEDRMGPHGPHVKYTVSTNTQFNEGNHSGKFYGYVLLNPYVGWPDQSRSGVNPMDYRRTCIGDFMSAERVFSTLDNIITFERTDLQDYGATSDSSISTIDTTEQEVKQKQKVDRKISSSGSRRRRRR